MKSNNSIFLVDGSSLAFRSFYALITSGMRNASGLPTWAVYGFLNSLFDLIDKRAPHSMAVCFDMKAPTFRHEEFEDYKANRQEMPDDLSIQWPLIKDAVDVFSIPVYELSGWEADDVIGTIAKKAHDKDLNTVIFTGDQDAFQLLDEHIQVLMPLREGGVKEFGRQEVFDKLGVWPEQVIDYKGLCGDVSDNIPGVRGIGPKTAVQLLAQYKTIDGIYEHLDEIKSNSVKTKLAEGKDKAYSSQGLATIRLDVPLDFDFEHCELTMPKDLNRVCEFLREFEFRNLLRRLPKILSNFNNGVEPEIDPALLQVAPRGRGATKSRAAAQEERAAKSTGGGAVQLALLEVAPQAATLTAGEVKALGAPGDTTIVRSLDQLVSAINTVQAAGYLSLSLARTGEPWFDEEITGVAMATGAGIRTTENGRLELAQDSWNVSTFYIPLAHVGEEMLSGDLAWSHLKPLLENDKIAKIIFDGKFVSHALARKGVTCQKFAFDPMLASYIINPSDRHGLREQAHRLLSYVLHDFGSGAKKVTAASMQSAQAGPFIADEARVVLELTRHYLEKLDFDQQELLWGMDLPVASVLSRMEANGVFLDLQYMSELQHELETGIRRLEREIYGLVGYSFNVGSPQQLQQVLFTELKLPTKGRTQTGSAFSTDSTVLEALVNAHPVVQKIIDYRELTKLNSTYVVALPRQVSPVDGRLHGEFNQAVATTGRLSSSNPNLQNIPIRTELGSRIRRAFIPAAEDHVILSADYSQIELRLLAHMSGDENLIDAFINDEDVHVRTARSVFDLKPEDVTSDHRRVGKTLNFALMYQQGAYATGLSLHITTKEAQSFIDKYFKSFPKVKLFQTRVLEEAKQRGFVETLWGRRRYFHNLNDRNDGIRKADERAAFNAPLQGSAADLMKLAMVKLDEELTARELKTKLILQVHDELVLDAPKSEVDEAIQIVRDAMAMGQPLLVPLKIDVGQGANWMDAK
ncbi:MAG: DNA polymerase I [Candidatus Obscuribacterales bacterium]|nr:DNA polymerase I [Candidatus Obscuribacterales bacterium]